MWKASATSDSDKCFASFNSPLDESGVADMTPEKRTVIARITADGEIFCEIFHSRIDNIRLNFTLGIPGMLQVEKF